MIVPMKKISLITMGDKKTKTLKKLRNLGTVHIAITEGYGERLNELREQIILLESAIFSVGKNKTAEKKEADAKKALSLANEIMTLTEEKKEYIQSVSRSLQEKYGENAVSVAVRDKYYN